MTDVTSFARSVRIEKSKASALLLLALLTLPSLIASAAPINDNATLGTSELIQELQPAPDESIDKEAVIEQAQSFMRSQFTENKGQVGNDEVMFYGNIPNGMIGFGISRVFVWLEGSDRSMIFDFVDSNQVVPSGGCVTFSRSNYFLGDRGTYTDINSFTEIWYPNLWSGIDLVYRATPNGAKYEYHVAPGADPQNIAVDVQNYDELLVSDTSLIVKTSGLPFFDNGLIAFQDMTEVKVGFDQIGSSTFGFSIESYDNSKSLIIDPLIYSTYVGGDSEENPQDVAIDSTGAAYVTGSTHSEGFPMVNPFDGTFSGPSGGSDIFVYKLNAAGNGLIYSTYVAGNEWETGWGIEVDSSGYAYVAGFTRSDDFPTVNAYDSTYDFGMDCVVFKLNQTGNGLEFSTYVGGSWYYDEAYDLAIDATGNSYVTGYTQSTNFPRVNAYDSSHNGGDDCFIFKLSSTGSTMIYSTFFGGSGDDRGRSIDIDQFGNAYVTGQTTSSDLPIINGIDDTYSGSTDCFVLKLSSAGNVVDYSSYLGGTGIDEGYGIRVKDVNQTYITGGTTSVDFPATGGYDSSHNGDRDIFLTYLNIADNTMPYSTYIGGTGYERADALHIDDYGSVYLVGFTLSSDFPMINSYDDTYDGNSDAFVLKVNSAGTSILYSTFFGGADYDYGRGIAVDSDGYAYVVVDTNGGVPIVSAYDATYNGGSDPCSFKLADLGDSDSDLLIDYLEVMNGTDRYNPDSDFDKVKDGHEVILYGTDPLNASEPTWASTVGYSTLVGGSSEDIPTDITVDHLGNVYVVGITHSTDFPMYMSFNDTYAGAWYDAFVFKLSPDGSNLIFSTFIGGSGEDYGLAIEVDVLQNVYVTGVTESSDFPIFNALFDSYTDTDCFVLKLNPSGDTLIFSTFVAGGNTDEPWDIFVDSSYNVYVSGTTYSTDFPTVNAYDSVYDGIGSECFVFKLNSTGNGLFYSTYFGGNSTEEVGVLAVDESGSVYLTGMTESKDLPLKNPFDSINEDHDLFLCKLNSTGNGLEFSTYLGGSGYEIVCSIQLDSAGDIYICGSAMASEFPYTTMIGSSADSDDIFVMKFNSTGNGLIFSTIVAGTDWDEPLSMEIDSTGAAYVASPTDSIDLPVVNTDLSPPGSYDSYVMKLSPDGTHLEFSSYIGGSGIDTDPYLALDSFGRVYVTSLTTSSDIPFVNEYDDTPNGGDDVFVIRLDWSIDSDSDGLPDFWEDEFGLNSSDASDALENWDADGLTNIEEYQNSCDPTDDDTDNDTLSDSDEVYVYGTNPTNNDTDYDLMPDNWEILNSLNPLLDDSSGDLDADQISNIVEYQIGSDPDDSDTDNDLMPDGWEYQNSLDVLVNDADDDADTDDATNLLEFNAGTDPNDPDSDDDLLTDGQELNTYSTDPLDPDSDNDNLTDFQEIITYGTNPLVVDSDLDNLSDGDEVLLYSTNPLDVTDPGWNEALTYSSYFGGSSSDNAWDIALDSAGNIYVVGSTYSSNLPLMNQYDGTLAGTTDCFVMKMDPTGSTLLFSTYIGGGSSENGRVIEVDESGNVFVCGDTQSSDFPTVSAYQSSHAGSYDLFVLKLHSSGSSLIYSTYLGGSEHELEPGMCIDNDGNAYIVGRTGSSDFPVFNGYDMTHDSMSDGFLTKINATGNGVYFSTFVGTNGDDFASAVAIDSGRNIYVAGRTSSYVGFSTSGAYDEIHNGGYDAYVLRVDSTGSTLEYCTYLGGGLGVGSGTVEYYEFAEDIAVDLNGSVYVTGFARSYNFPVVNGFPKPESGGDDCFVAKFNPDLSSLLYSTFLGGQSDDQGYSIFVDSLGNAYVTGYTDSPEFPVKIPYDGIFGGSSDIFVSKINATGNGLHFSTFIGGSDTDRAYGIALNATGFIHIAGYTYSTDFPKLNPYDGTYSQTECAIVILADFSDSDSDGLSDYNESLIGTDRLSWDSDSDSLSDKDELDVYLTDPLSNDTDLDLMPDGWEVGLGLDPNSDDSMGDLDTDGLENVYEFLYGTLADNNDTDSDTLLDGLEVYTYGTDPLSVDTDSDMLLDPDEIFVYGTDPTTPYSDSDIMPDGWEIQHGLNPLADDSGGDPDTDLLVNEDEYIWGTDPQNPDTDLDSFTDGYEVHTLGSDPLDPLSPLSSKEPEFSTFIGGSSDDTFYDAIVDSEGNIYITGYVKSSNFPIVGAYDGTYNGNWDTVVVKLNSTGNGVVFSTYIGGSNDERGLEFYIGTDFSVWFTGYTASSNFPTVNAYDSTYNGGWDGFIVHLSANGSSLLYSTFIGGSGDDLAEFITFDDDGYLYLSGFTRSSNFPVVNGYDTTFNGDRDAFALKMQPDLHGFVFSTFLGGSGYDYTYGSRIAANGDFLIAGVTTSTNFPMLNSFDSTYNGGDDIFVTRLNAAGNALIFSTYIGGSGEEYFGKFDLDQQENLLMGGSTMSSDFPTRNAYDSTFNGGRDAFALKLASNGSALYFSTYIGGSGSDTVYGVQVDRWNNIHLSGVTTSTDLPVKNAFQNESQGMDDTFVFKINSTGNGLLYSTYLGGSADDGQRGMAIDKLGRVYIVGWTQSSDHPVVNAYDDTINSVSDGFITCFRPLDDEDSDGIPDDIEILLGTNRFSNDSDSDSMIDGWEYFHGLDPLVNDSYLDLDSDSLLNIEEYALGTFPETNDTDSDMMPDAYEVFYGLNPWVNDASTSLDNDSLSNLLEYQLGTLPNYWDSDYDLMPDDFEYWYGLDPLVDDADGDLDSDTLTNLEEFYIGTFPNNIDSDYDLMPDGWEVDNGLLPWFDDGGDDHDGDDLTNYEEFVLGTDPQDSDSDSDLMPDGWEYSYGLDPLVNDAGLDGDSDGLSNLGEYNAQTDPTNSDSDSDLMPDGWEVSNGLNPIADDASNDPDSDTLTNLEEYLNGTDPLSSDSDSDTMPDGWELDNGLNPLLDDGDADADSDELSNALEYEYGTDPQVADSDSDNLIDGQEITYGTDPLIDDTDIDMLLDGDEVHQYGTDPTLYDTDHDTLSDGEEVLIYGTNPLLADSDFDGLSDSQEIAMGLNPMINNFVANAGIIIAVVAIIVVVIVYWRKVRIPQQKAKKRQMVELFIENSRERGEVDDYYIEENSPLWYVGTIFASYKKKGGKQRDPAPVLEHLVTNEFPGSFEQGAEKTLMGMCLELAAHQEFSFLSWLSAAITKKMAAGQFSLKLKDNDFRMKCWQVAQLGTPAWRSRGLTNEDRAKLSNIITELQSKKDLQDEFIPYVAQVLMVSWDSSAMSRSWIADLFKPMSFEYKFEFLMQFRKVGGTYEKMLLLDGILSGIKLKELLDKPEEEWEKIISEIVGAGYASRPIPFDTDDIAGFPFEKRFSMASVIQKNKTDLKNEESFSKLLFVDAKDHKKFYDYEIPQGILTHSMNMLKSRVRETPAYISINRVGILSVLREYQDKRIDLETMMSFVNNVPESIQDKIHANPGTRGAFRYAISTVIIEKVRKSDFDSVAPLLKIYREPFDLVLNFVEKTINQTLVAHGNDKNLQQFLLTLQAELLESGSDKKSVRKIVDWLKLWSLIYETTKGAKQHHGYVAGLLDVVKETKGSFEPRAITEQVLTIINDEFERTVRIFRGTPRLDNLTYRTRTDAAKAWMESVKHAYYKLLLMADNSGLELSDDDRDHMRKVAHEILGFVIRVRREDFLERMEHFPIDIGDVIDPGHLLKSSIEKSHFVLLPESFHTFPLPALIVLNEFLRNPIRLPFVGNKQQGVLINPMFWVFGASISLALIPTMVMAEQTYSNYFIGEYLKTAALAVKQAEEPIGKLLIKVDPNLTAENMIVKSFKQLMDLHYLQGVITREMVIVALEFGGWNTALADKIIEEKDYCVYCSFELPKDAETCPNCGKPVVVLDVSAITPDEVQVDLSELGLDMAEGGPTEPRPGGGGLEVE
ncbi:MAG: hypothetical protein EAX87_07335 [Candidatus Thorarchaeota archaeon]|nr:hypothetical protein [Candidatus Thorarchaeota archaeon]